MTRDLVAARRIAKSCGLVGWRIVWDPRPTRRIAQTRYTTKTIGLSVKLVGRLTDEQFDQVVRHEVAHALVGPGYRHGPVWKRQAYACGVRKPRAGVKVGV